MYIGAIYGGSRSAILLNIPGTPANAATTVDGYPLALQGRAGEAIGIATTGSFLGSMIGMLAMLIFTPLIGTRGPRASSPSSSSGSPSSGSSSAGT
ncbi:MAG: tripartite tricarboxylate transporter permease [Chromatiales bacterium]|nr:tripartite tricarboxylate transporter permease [Chromatiales bacterium]